MSDGTLSQVKIFISNLFKVLEMPLKIVGALLVISSVSITLIGMLFKKNNDQRAESILHFLNILIGSFVIGAALVFLGFYTGSFIN